MSTTKGDFHNLGGKVGKLFFAGDATDPDWWGFAQGALYTGEEKAREIVKCMKGRLRAVPLWSVTSKLGRTGDSEFTRARKARVRSERKPRGSWGEGEKGGRDCILFCNRRVQISPPPQHRRIGLVDKQ